MRFLITTLILIEIYAIVAMALNLLIGVSGKFSVYEASLVGVGAYTAGLVAKSLGLDLMWGCLVAAVVAASLGVAFQVMTRHMDFFTFKIASLTFAMVLYETMLQWREVTGGASGLQGVPRPLIAGISFESIEAYLVLTTLCVTALAGFLLYLERSQFALALRGMRDGENSLESLGRNTFMMKVKVFAISAAVAGFAGGLLAGLTKSVHPSMFYVYLSIVFIVYVVAGGRGNLRGTLIAAFVLMTAEQFIAAIPNLPVTYIGPFQRIFYGSVLLVVVLYRPNGLAPEVPIIRRKTVAEARPDDGQLGFLTHPDRNVALLSEGRTP